MNQNKLSILGIRGIPANHGGFETFAEKLALYLVGRKWKVTVYCQDDNVRETIKEKWVTLYILYRDVRTRYVTARVEAASPLRSW